MKLLVLVALLFVAGCSGGNSPVAPTPVTPPVVVVPPVVTPPVTPTAPVFPPTDSRFDLAFYRAFAHNSFEGPIYVLHRQAEAPRIYLRTVDNAGRTIDAVSLDRTAAALINTTGQLTGAFGLAGLERGTDTRLGQRGWITVYWSDDVDPTACGRAQVGGNLITLYPYTPRCRCDGLAVSVRTVKHELGHALGFHHTGVRDDLMSGLADGKCDAEPSARERYHASIAYTRPIGSAAP